MIFDWLYNGNGAKFHPRSAVSGQPVRLSCSCFPPQPQNRSAKPFGPTVQHRCGMSVTRPGFSSPHTQAVRWPFNQSFTILFRDGEPFAHSAIRSPDFHIRSPCPAGKHVPADCGRPSRPVQITAPDWKPHTERDTRNQTKIAALHYNSSSVQNPFNRGFLFQTTANARATFTPARGLLGFPSRRGRNRTGRETLFPRQTESPGVTPGPDAICKLAYSSTVCAAS